MDRIAEIFFVLGLAIPFLLFAMMLILGIVRCFNYRDDPRHAKRPPDPP